MVLTKIGASLGGSADIINVTQTTHTFVSGDRGKAVKMTNDSGTPKYALARANTAANAEAVGIIIDVADGNNFTLALSGRITVDACIPSGVAGTVVFLHEGGSSDLGTLTATEPSTAGEVSKPMAVITIAGSEMIMIQQRGEVIGSGAITIADNSITSAKIVDGAIMAADINASAAIEFSQMENLTTSRALVTDGNGDILVSGVTTTELEKLDGLTSSTAELNKLAGASANVTAANLTALTGTGATALHSHAALKLDDLATPDDNDDLDSSTSEHGLLRKLDNSTTNFLRGDGAWAAAGGGSLVLKSSTLITSSTGSITVTGLTSHDTHLIILSSMVPTADGPYAQLNLGTGVGIIEANDSYAWHHFAIRANSTTPIHTAYTSGSEAARIILYRRGVGSATAEGFSAAIWIHYNRTSEFCRTHVHGTFNGESYLGEADGGIFQAQTLSTIDLDRVRFMFSSGSIETGRMTVYGLSYS